MGRQCHLLIRPLLAHPWVINCISGQIFSVRSFIVHNQGHLPIHSLWACPWAKNCISATVGWIFAVWNTVELSRSVGLPRHGHLSFCHLWAFLPLQLLDGFRLKFREISLGCSCATSLSWQVWLLCSLRAYSWVKYMDHIMGLYGMHISETAALVSSKFRLYKGLVSAYELSRF